MLAVLAAVPPVEAEASADSRLLVTMEITYGVAESVQISVYEGELATLRDDAGYALGFIPRLVDASGGDLSIELVALDVGVAGGPAPSPRAALGRLDAKVGFTSFTAAGVPAPVGFRVVAVGPAPPAADFLAAPARECTPSARAAATVPDPDGPLALRQVGGCCVTCGSTTACGCAVSMSCGSCCGCSFC